MYEQLNSFPRELNQSTKKEIGANMECRAKLRADGTQGVVDQLFEKRVYEYTYSPVKLEIKILIGQDLNFCIHV